MKTLRLLSFRSMNLMKALNWPGNADSECEAVPVNGTVEVFVFGVGFNSPLRSAAHPRNEG